MKNKPKSIICKCRLLAFIIFVECVISGFLLGMCPIESLAEAGKLYALNACLYDGDNERVLFEKNGYEAKPMASTTKIMTCIIALEYGNLEDIVEVSKYAASMPKVKLGAVAGEKYRLGDLLYSLMLESHNDSAVIIAEHISGSVEEFTKLMNEKARDLQCINTYFITPNGLDATKEENGVIRQHSTTAAELCKIMSYCIKNPDFLKITQTQSYSFSDKKVSGDGGVANGARVHTVTNKNAFLTMMEGAVSGKTGFTGGAGYCYVGALKRDGKTLIVALLGCGWPNNKGYKWKDTMYLMNYGLDNYYYKTINEEYFPTPIKVNNGISGDKRGEVIIYPQIVREEFGLLCSDEEKITTEIEINNCLEAPVKSNEIVGYFIYKINGKEVFREKIQIGENVEKYNIIWCLERLLKMFFL